MKTFTLLALLVATLALPAQERWVPDAAWFKRPHYLRRPETGFVDKKETAIKIGRALIEGRLGPSQLKSDEPLDAKRFGDVWVVYGYSDVSMSGSPTIVEISASTGTVINMVIEQ